MPITPSSRVCAAQARHSSTLQKPRHLVLPSSATVVYVAGQQLVAVRVAQAREVLKREVCACKLCNWQ